MRNRRFAVSLGGFFLLCCLFVTVNPAKAARITGKDLLYYCNMDIEGEEMVAGGHATCQAYISGVIDYHNMLRSMKIAPEVDICIPQDTKLYTLHLAVLKYLRANKANVTDFVAAPAVTMALYGKYPCRKK